jgi:hypothetical protein
MFSEFWPSISFHRSAVGDVEYISIRLSSWRFCRTSGFGSLSKIETVKLILRKSHEIVEMFSGEKVMITEEEMNSDWSECNQTQSKAIRLNILTAVSRIFLKFTKTLLFERWLYCHQNPSSLGASCHGKISFRTFWQSKKRKSKIENWKLKSTKERIFNVILGGRKVMRTSFFLPLVNYRIFKLYLSIVYSWTRILSV